MLGSSPGPLVPADVDEGRIVAFGDNQTLLLDRTGATILSIPISVAAAQLAGSDLVLVRRGALLHYDARTGALDPQVGLAGRPQQRIVREPSSVGMHRVAGAPRCA